MQQVTIGGTLYQVKATVYDVLSLLKRHEEKLLRRANRIQKGKRVKSEAEINFEFVIDALYTFLVPKKFLFISIKPFISRKALAKAITLEELKHCDVLISQLTGLSTGESGDTRLR